MSSAEEDTRVDSESAGGTKQLREERVSSRCFILVLNCRWLSSSRLIARHNLISFSQLNTFWSGVQKPPHLVAMVTLSQFWFSASQAWRKSNVLVMKLYFPRICLFLSYHQHHYIQTAYFFNPNSFVSYICIMLHCKLTFRSRGFLFLFLCYWARRKLLIFSQYNGKFRLKIRFCWMKLWVWMVGEKRSTILWIWMVGKSISGKSRTSWKIFRLSVLIFSFFSYFFLESLFFLHFFLFFLPFEFLFLFSYFLEFLFFLFSFVILLTSCFLSFC